MRPQVLIAAGDGVFDLIQQDLDLGGAERKSNNQMSYYETADRIVIDAYHPNRQPKYTYCDEIIDAVRQWTLKNAS